jgi:hypothetical protein
VVEAIEGQVGVAVDQHTLRVTRSIPPAPGSARTFVTCHITGENMETERSRHGRMTRRVDTNLVLTRCTRNSTFTKTCAYPAPDAQCYVLLGF